MPDPEMVLGLGSLGSLLVLRSLDEVDFVVFGDMALVFFGVCEKARICPTMYVGVQKSFFSEGFERKILFLITQPFILNQR